MLSITESIQPTWRIFGQRSFERMWKFQDSKTSHQHHQIRGRHGCTHQKTETAATHDEQVGGNWKEIPHGNQYSEI